MATRPRIVVIGLGGTIGMVRGDDGALRPAQSVAEIAQRVPAIEKYADLTLVSLASLDSTNVGPEHWTALLRAVAEVVDRCDAVLVLHGTDTMAYTATAVALGLPRGGHPPIAFTGSQLPLASDHTDAARNLIGALLYLRLAVRRGLSEVVIAFGDRVLRASRAIKTSEIRFPAFDSPAFPPLAELTAAGIRLGGYHERRSAVASSVPAPPVFESRILTLDMTPGLPPALLRAVLTRDACRGLILRSLGTGNIPNRGPNSLVPVIHEATARQIPVLVTTKFIGGFTRMALYEPGKEALDAGAIPTGDMTDVAAQVKLMVGLGKGLFGDELARWLLRDCAGELTTAEDLEEEII